MTLVAALEGKHGIVLAADSRGTVGDPRGLTAINDTQTKLFKLSDWCGIGMSGAAELATTLIESERSTASNRHPQRVLDSSGPRMEATLRPPLLCQLREAIFPMLVASQPASEPWFRLLALRTE